MNQPFSLGGLLEWILRSIYELEAVKFGAFKLKLHETEPNAPKSPIFLNLRTPENPKPGPLTPDVVAAIGDYLFRLSEVLGLEYDAVTGIPRAGEPFADAFVRVSGRDIPILHLNKLEGADGKRSIGNVIEGHFKKGWRVLVLDDLITEAHSKLETIRALEENGLLIAAVLTFVDREQGGAESLVKRDYRFEAGVTLSQMMEFYRSWAMITEEKCAEVAAYQSANYKVI